MTRVREDVEKLESLCAVGRKCKCCSCYGKQHISSSKKLLIELPHDSAVLLLGMYPKDSRNLNLYTHIHNGLIHNSQKEGNMNLHQQMRDEQSGACTYNGTLKRKKMSTHATTWMNPECIRLSEITSHKGANALILVI